MGGWATNWNRDVLERIVVLLFALANLADLAAGAPFHRRRQVLEILSHGEAEARAFVLGMAIGAPAPESLEDAPGVAGDAAGLAIRLRALALMLCILLARTGQSASSDPTGSRTGRPVHELFRPAAGWPGDALAPPAPDTS